MPGTVRSAVRLEPAALQRLLPGVPAESLATVTQLLSTVSLEALSPTRCAAWGDEPQRSYAAYTDAVLLQARSPALDESSRHVQRLYTVLGEVAAALAPEATSVWSLFRRPPPSPNAVYASHRVEVDDLRHRLNGAIAHLEAMQAEFTALGARGAVLRGQLESHVMAAQVLASLIAPRDSSCEQLLIDRGLSLARAAAHLREGEVLRASHQARVADLAVVVRDVVLGALPAWLEQIAYIQTPTPTERYDLRQRIDAILLQLRR